MYASIVAGNVRSPWRHLNARDFNFVLQQFASTFRYEFFGDHALSGVRHRVPTMKRFLNESLWSFPTHSLKFSTFWFKAHLGTPQPWFMFGRRSKMGNCTKTGFFKESALAGVVLSKI